MRAPFGHIRCNALGYETACVPPRSIRMHPCRQVLSRPDSNNLPAVHRELGQDFDEKVAVVVVVVVVDVVVVDVVVVVVIVIGCDGGDWW